MSPSEVYCLIQCFGINIQNHIHGTVELCGTFAVSMRETGSSPSSLCNIHLLALETSNGRTSSFQARTDNQTVSEKKLCGHESRTQQF